MPLQTWAENILYAAEGCPARRRWRSGGGAVQAPATRSGGRSLPAGLGSAAEAPGPWADPVRTEATLTPHPMPSRALLNRGCWATCVARVSNPNSLPRKSKG